MNNDKNDLEKSEKISTAMDKLTDELAIQIQRRYGIENWVYCRNTAKVIAYLVFAKAFKQFSESPTSEYNQIFDTLFNDYINLISILIDTKITLEEIINEMNENKNLAYTGKDGKDYYSKEGLEAANRQYDETMSSKIDTSHKIR